MKLLLPPTHQTDKYIPFSPSGEGGTWFPLMVKSLPCWCHRPQPKASGTSPSTLSPDLGASTTYPNAHLIPTF